MYAGCRMDDEETEFDWFDKCFFVLVIVLISIGCYSHFTTPKQEVKPKRYNVIFKAERGDYRLEIRKLGEVKE